MKHQYNYLIGCVLLTFLASSYYFRETKYYNYSNGNEVSKQRHNESPNYSRPIETYNYELGAAASIATSGIGFLLIGLANRGKKQR